jgi:hypothetical protein
MTSKHVFSVKTTEEYIAFFLIEGIMRELGLSWQLEGHPEPLWIVTYDAKPAFRLKIDFKRKGGSGKVRVEGRKIEDPAHFEDFMNMLDKREPFFMQSRTELERDFCFTQQIGPIAFSYGVGSLPNREITINKCVLFPHKYPRKLETPQGIFGKQISFERVHSAITIVKAIDGYEAPQLASRRFKETCAILSLISGCTLTQWGIPQINFTEAQMRGSEMRGADRIPRPIWWIADNCTWDEFPTMMNLIHGTRRAFLLWLDEASTNRSLT